MRVLNAEYFAHFIINTLACKTIVIPSFKNIAYIAKIASGFMNKKLLVVVGAF
jgi:hypothetical protein